ncbi:MAG: lytic transglycosylase domain-containing protein [Gammaproteobacteria bacterium]|nr:lytic transglycosylase domain-containing protein [Gammaproteobacteria bacterium]
MRLHIFTVIIVLWPGFFCSTSYAQQEQRAITPELRELLEHAIQSTDSFEDRFEAEVWLTDMSTRLKLRVSDDRERLTILRATHYEATRADLAPELVLAVMEVESGFDRFAISKAGALGLMQIMPFWLRELKQPQANLFDITTNLRIGCTILKYYLDMEKGNLHRALARYNGSHGKRHYPDKVFTALSERWFRN